MRPTIGVHLKALPDNIVEAYNETVTLTITPTSTYVLNGAALSATGSLTIIDDAPVVSVSASDAVEGGATGGFTFTRSGGDLATALSVDYTVSGTADEVDDYVELSGTVEFAVGEDIAFVDIQATSDNVADPDETVIAEIDNAGTTYLAGEDDTATVTIVDQFMTVSVARDSDGEEGVSDGKFLFTRAGDLSEELVVEYTIGGTATGAGDLDYVELTGTVTFDEDEGEVYVLVDVADDILVEGSETVTVTIVEDEAFQISAGDASLFIKDDDTNKVFWISSGSTDWSVGSNWSKNEVPDDTDDVYFWASKSNVDCANLGYGEEVLVFLGLHVEAEYSGTITLGAPLSASMFELKSDAATIDQPEDMDITATVQFTWTEGKLNTIDSGTSVTISGATGIIDAPEEGSISTTSTLCFTSGSRSAFYPGVYEFLGGEGMYVAAEVKVRSKNATLEFKKETGTK